MPLEVVLPLVAFAALAALLLVVGRRAGRVLAETREAETFRRATADLAGRVETSLAGVTERIDLVRRRQVEATTIRTNLDAALDAVVRYVAEARSLEPPDTLDDVRQAMVDELERAERALQMVEHGCDILAAVRRGSRELEAQTSIKRGYLNVLHAREAIAEHATIVASSRTPNEPRWFSNRRSA
jgi:hypothetical protein